MAIAIMIAANAGAIQSLERVEASWRSSSAPLAGREGEHVHQP